MTAPLPANEAERLAALRSYGLLDTPAEAAFDDIVQLAAYICSTPISLLSLVDADRQWFKARHGLDVVETPRDLSFCAHAILQPGELLLVPDAPQDRRFADNQLVTGAPHIHFYAGMPLTTPGGHALGSLCVIDRQPRQLSAAQLDALQMLARQVGALLEVRRQKQLLADAESSTSARNAELSRANFLLHTEIEERKRIEAERERLITELQAALAEVKTLSGLLPICGWCKKIRDDSGYWNSVEGYLKKSTGVDITHGICPECQAKMMAELEKVSGFLPPSVPSADSQSDLV